VLIRVFIGGILQEELAGLPDEQLIEIATEELGELMGVKGEPRMVHISRYPKSMPQYYVGHMDKMAKVREASERLPGLYFAGNMFAGVGMPYCIHHSEQIAEQIASG
jgi:oxygen-dependent protoporphyrinogen oxidase